MEEGCSTSANSWISASNWLVIHGSLNNSISFETPLSEISEDTTVESTNISKDQLKLSSPTTDSGPCEIKISFSQKHEIRQVYVCSTARVYEIYYAPDEKSGNEYLCTVKCSAAAKEDASVNASDNGEANGVYPEGSSGTWELPAEKSKSYSSQSTNEDDWVEVKASVSPFLVNSVFTKIDKNTETNFQDFYEATAEISDADPCISITIRLLSLQTQGCIHLGEIYIFGEPVDSVESEIQVGPLQNSAGSSLMAMLVPTLLQLSKSGSRTQEKNASDTKEGLKSKKIESLNPNKGRLKQQEVQSSISDEGEIFCKEESKGNADLQQLESDKQIPSTGRGSDFVTKENDQSFGRIERVLDHIVARIVRMENFCLRFEEKMLKPISCIDTRLEQLERQLEVLTTRSQCSEFNTGTRFRAPDFSGSGSLVSSLYSDGNKPCTRFTAPEFSGGDSLSNSTYDDGNNEQFPKVSAYASMDNPCMRKNAPEFLGNEAESRNSVNNDGINDHNTVGLELSDKDFNIGEPSSPIGDPSVSSVVPQYSPCLVVKAPEFLSDGENGDDKNCTEVYESSEKICSISKKLPLSVDEALASALAGFLSTTSLPSPKPTQTLEISKENCEIEKSSIIPCKQATDPGTSCDEISKPETVNSSDSLFCSSSQEKELQVTMKLTNEKSPDLVPEQTPIFEEWFTDPTNESQTSTVRRHPFEACWDDTMAHVKARINKGNEERDSMNSLEGAHIDSENILERNRSSVIDFELPILDVIFASRENWNANSPLETLLNEDDHESNIQHSHGKDKNEDDGSDKSVEQTHIFSADDDKSQIPSPLDDYQLFSLMAIDDLTDQTLVQNKEPELVEGSSACQSDKPYSSLI